MVEKIKTAQKNIICCDIRLFHMETIWTKSHVFQFSIIDKIGFFSVEMYPNKYYSLCRCHNDGGKVSLSLLSLMHLLLNIVYYQFVYHETGIKYGQLNGVCLLEQNKVTGNGVKSNEVYSGHSLNLSDKITDFYEIFYKTMPKLTQHKKMV